MANPVPGQAFGMFTANGNGNTPATSTGGLYHSIAHLSSTANNFHGAASSSTATTRANANQFRVPAHKHAHHLHSIPPREKSTRTLIIDHMLWVHARTRFAQARAELGMTDRTGGSRSQNYKHRRRPENYEEEEEVGSDGEDVGFLKTRAPRRNDPYNDEEDERLRTQDLPLARDLRLRAEGVEKVVLSMLDQPPQVPPMPEKASETPPTSPELPNRVGTGSHPHILPDGVRLRLALGTVINDLFARHAPPLSFRHQTPAQTPNLGAAPTPIPSNSPIPPLYDASTTLPSALTNLSFISAYSPLLPGYNQTNYPPKTPITPSPRTHALYKDGVDSHTANSPPSLRCPRHLHAACEICVEARIPFRILSRARSTPQASSRLQRPAPMWKGTTAGISPDGGGISGWEDTSGIGSGLARPPADGNVLRQAVERRQNGNSTKLAALIPRFLRLSALVACELGRETREEAGLEVPPSIPTRTEDPYGGKAYGELSPLPQPASASHVLEIQALQNKLYGLALRPTRQWYMLLAGLLTRAALEGYLSGDWAGSHAVECLLTVGLGIIEGKEVSGVDKEYEQYEPDELPTLSDAARMLFPSLRPGAPLRKGDAEAEFEMEMDERLKKACLFFYDIPAATPDLATHMEDLAWQYPAEPVERAAVRFCEAIAKWRGKPELETETRHGNRYVRSSATVRAEHIAPTPPPRICEAPGHRPVFP
ncbi:hypothetical protein CYLTODRAFT_367426 [Cylindrobasidium torrendii FP15055 ss-10]|uniref:Uncharacterized protein n=1 Tax=Cylindrobasidium torrendii FP15055 ss-10 TaxID=1314674 RepID=A0A0D7BPT9_9AGAR|nr:hypothetical protein CYLTODRAFT_367426 [Cylindrobasidium torrendii FP15055 ss-10]